MMVLARSTVCIRSQITRYGDSGVVLWVSRGIHCWSHSCLSVAISWATAVRRPRGLPPSRCLTSAISASSVRAASPISAWWTGMSLARSAGSSVAWIITLPLGIGTP